jgi:hypothetical protein
VFVLEVPLAEGEFGSVAILIDVFLDIDLLGLFFLMERVHGEEEEGWSTACKFGYFGDLREIHL